MLQFQKALRTIVGPPDAAWRLGDALKTEFLALGAELKKPRRAFSAPTNYSPKKLLTNVQRVEPTETPRPFEFSMAFE